MDLVTEGHKAHLPYEVKATSNFTNLNTEDLCHIGFVVKFFLKKRNDYGATFIKEVFPDFGGFNISEGVTHLKPR